MSRYGFYVASRVKHAAMWRDYRSLGIPITSTWIDEAEEGQTADMGELWERIEREIRGSLALVLFAGADDFPQKGALVEAGMAIALGVPVRVVLGPGVVLEPGSYRPLGSWANHPAVCFCQMLSDAFNVRFSRNDTSRETRRDETAPAPQAEPATGSAQGVVESGPAGAARHPRVDPA